jgi:phosphatidylglycerophosphatase A
MKYQNIIIPLSTFGSCGYFTGSGTLATLITLPIVLIFRLLLSQFWFGIFVLLFTLVSFFIIECGLDFFGQSDPSQIVLDEAIGCFITFYALPLNLFTIVAGFLLFRLFDITKCCGIQTCETLKGAWGVMLDDILAGILANILVHYTFDQLIV